VCVCACVCLFVCRGVFFFFTMEFLQVFQYMVIAPDMDSILCESNVNKVLTLLGFLHICMQPYFCHVINASLTKNAKYLDRYIVIKRLCIIGGGMLFARHFLAPFWSTMDFQRDGAYASTEWLRGEKLCTFKGRSVQHRHRHQLQRLRAFLASLKFCPYRRNAGHSSSLCDHRSNRQLMRVLHV
jgi:hypothetical protein